MKKKLSLITLPQKLAKAKSRTNQFHLGVSLDVISFPGEEEWEKEAKERDTIRNYEKRTTI